MDVRDSYTLPTEGLLPSPQILGKAEIVCQVQVQILWAIRPENPYYWWIFL